MIMLCTAPYTEPLSMTHKYSSRAAKMDELCESDHPMIHAAIMRLSHHFMTINSDGLLEWDETKSWLLFC
jgi:hypothetical protein